MGRGDRRARRERLFARLRSAVLDGPGDTAAPERAAAFHGLAVQDERLAAYLDRVRRSAYKVTDEEVEALLAAGYSEDALFELTVAAALGAGMLRREMGLEAVRAASNTKERHAAQVG